MPNLLGIWMEKEDSPARLTKNDKLVLKELVENARVSDTDVAKKLKLTPPAIMKIRKKLETKGVITEYMPVLNLKKLGIDVMVMFSIKIRPGSWEKFEHLKKFLIKKDNLFWACRVSQVDTNYIFLCAYRNISDMSEDFFKTESKNSDCFDVTNKHIYSPELLLKSSYSGLVDFAISGEYDARTFLKATIKRPFGKKHVNAFKVQGEKTVLIKNDRLVLEELLKNARASDTDVAKKLKLTPPAIMKIRKKLEDKGFITGYSARFDPRKLGMDVMAVVTMDVTTKGWAIFDEENVRNVLNSHKFLIYCARTPEIDAPILTLYAFRSIEELNNHFLWVQSNLSEYLIVKKIVIFTPEQVVKDSCSGILNI